MLTRTLSVTVLRKGNAHLPKAIVSYFSITLVPKEPTNANANAVCINVNILPSEHNICALISKRIHYKEKGCKESKYSRELKKQI